MAGVFEREGCAVGQAFGEGHVFGAVAAPGAGGDQTHRAKCVSSDPERYAHVGAGVDAAQGFKMLRIAHSYVLDHTLRELGDQLGRARPVDPGGAVRPAGSRW